MAHQSGGLGTRVTAFVLTLVVLFLGGAAGGQSQSPGQTVILQGTVRDSGGCPIAGATVFLQGESGTQSVTARTDSAGGYRFLALHGGVYALRAEMAGYGVATSSPFVVGPKEGKSIDLTLELLKPSRANDTSPQTSGSGVPEFYDEPQFTVAGVTDAANPGGHGSNVALRTTEALTKETVSLGAVGEDKASIHHLPVNASVAAREASLRAVAESEPTNFVANHELGKLLLDEAKAGDAIPYLERASQRNPGDSENDRELALAYANTGKYESARAEVRGLLARPVDSSQRDIAGYVSTPDTAALHHLLGEVEEKLGDSLGAVQEYQRAAELQPSESNLFDWGAELLMHRAFEPATEVFTKGTRLFPGSVRMLSGLGVAWYARGSYDMAFQRMCEASDLNPDDPQPYLFLGKMQNAETVQLQELIERLARFARLQPDNPLANYYYALSLWKQREGSDNRTQVESLLNKAVRLDPQLGAGYLQLGIVYSDQGNFSAAISAYQTAIEVSPGLDEAHYRLAQSYERNGQKQKAQQELSVYEQISKKQEADLERERQEIREFVYTLRGQGTVAGPK